MYLSDGSVTNLADLTISGNHLIGNNPLGKGIYQQTGAELHMQSDVTDADDGPGGPVQGS